MDEEKSFRTPHKSKTGKSETKILQPRAELQSRAWNTMKWFDGTAKNELTDLTAPSNVRVWQPTKNVKVPCASRSFRSPIAGVPAATRYLMLQFGYAAGPKNRIRIAERGRKHVNGPKNLRFCAFVMKSAGDGRGRGEASRLVAAIGCQKMSFKSVLLLTVAYGFR